MYKIIWRNHFFNVPNKMLLFNREINKIHNKDDFLNLCHELLEYNNWDLFYEVAGDIIKNIHEANILDKEYMWTLILFHIVLNYHGEI